MWQFIHEPDAGGTTGALTGAMEVVITFHETVPAATAINIQTGAYSGQTLAPTVEGTTTLTLPVTFSTDALIQVMLNGLELKKPEDVARASATQITLTDRIKRNTILKVRKYV